MRGRTIKVGKHFFERPTLTVARELLGKYLVKKSKGKTIARMITETEAYDGPLDLASHASKGRTARTDVMFGEAGIWYVYLIYGMYEMLNIVTGPTDYPAAVLIRGVEGIDGPGKLTREFGITRSVNLKAVGDDSGVWIEDRGVRVRPSDIERTPRIGVAYAGEWAKKPMRFVLRKEALQPQPSRRSRQRGRPSLS